MKDVDMVKVREILDSFGDRRFKTRVAEPLFRAAGIFAAREERMRMNLTRELIKEVTHAAEREGKHEQGFLNIITRMPDGTIEQDYRREGAMTPEDEANWMNHAVRVHERDGAKIWKKHGRWKKRHGVEYTALLEFEPQRPRARAQA